MNEINVGCDDTPVGRCLGIVLNSPCQMSRYFPGLEPPGKQAGEAALDKLLDLLFKPRKTPFIHSENYCLASQSSAATYPESLLQYPMVTQNACLCQLKPLYLP